MLKIIINYPDRNQELEILNKSGFMEEDSVEAVMDPARIKLMADLVRQIYVDDKLKEYIVDLVLATREPKKYGMSIGDYVEFGASPRATIFLAQAARVRAFLQGRSYVTPQDIKIAAPDVLRHRIILSFEAEAEDVTTDEIIKTVFDFVEVP